MGFSRLILVNPKDYPCQQATVMASGAHDILKNALEVPSLEEALKPFHYTIGASARHRTLSWPMVESRQMASEIVNKLKIQQTQVALVFGTESSGLSNHELSLCDAHVYIPSDEDYGSLNLSQAVQVLAYEMRMHLIGPVSAQLAQELPATFEQKEGFYHQLEQSLTQLGVLDPNHPRRLMSRMRRLFNRSNLTETEVNILRGIFKAVQSSSLEKS